MISQIEALNFRSLRYIKQHLGRFHVLVGPNAAGKTTFLDILPLISDVVSEGPSAAIDERTDNFEDLLWGREGKGFHLAIEALVPDSVLADLRDKGYNTIRYEIEIGLTNSKEVGILGEKAILLSHGSVQREEFGELFPRNIVPPRHIYSAKQKRPLNSRLVLHKNPEGNDNFYSEVTPNKGGGWLPSFRFGPSKSALGNLPDDGSRFPVSTWLRDFLSHDVQKLVLNSLAIRCASPVGQGEGFKLDGSNLPWVVQRLAVTHPDLFDNWVAHVRTALPEIESIRTAERKDDKKLYLIISYAGGLDVPSWMVSDGTLRLLALTLPAYLPDIKGVFLIEEPENGIHPKAVETVVQSLSSVYGAQVLLATHSQVILNTVELKDILCFSKNRDGATDIVSGTEHPALKDWKGAANLGILFGTGVLG